MIYAGNQRIGRIILNRTNQDGIYAGPELIWGREVELLQMFKASVIADGGIFDEELFTAEFFRVHQTIRNEAIVLIVCGAYKAGIIYGINCITGQAVPFTFGRASVGTYIDKFGKIQTAGTNMPRINYDPVTLGLRGYLNENGVTNLIPNSLFNGNITGWIPSNCTPSYPATLSKRGRKFVELTKTSSVSVSSIAINSIMSGANTRIAYRVTIRAGTSTSATISLGGSSDSVTNDGLWGNSSSTGFRKIDGPGTLTREVGTVIIVSGLSATEDTEVEVWRQYTGNTSLQAIMYPGKYSVANPGESCLFSTPQLEINALGVCTSQIDTNGSQQTRAVDILVSQSNLIDDAGSTLYWEGIRLSSGGPNTIFVRHPTMGGGYAFYKNQLSDIDSFHSFDGTNAASVSLPGSNGVPLRGVSSFGPGGLKINVNSGPISRIAYDGIYGTADSLFPHRLMGSTYGSGRVQNHLRAFAILHRQLSDAEHIAITQP